MGYCTQNDRPLVKATQPPGAFSLWGEPRRKRSVDRERAVAHHRQRRRRARDDAALQRAVRAMRLDGVGSRCGHGRPLPVQDGGPLGPPRPRAPKPLILLAKSPTCVRQPGEGDPPLRRTRMFPNPRGAHRNVGISPFEGFSRGSRPAPLARVPLRSPVWAVQECTLTRQVETFLCATRDLAELGVMVQWVRCSNIHVDFTNGSDKCV